MSDDIIDCLDSAKNKTSNIMVVGVGGGGGNAVKYMYNLGIHNVMFMVCNTDIQALSRSPIPLKIQLGCNLTEGLGAGNKPERGRDAAIESSEEIRENLMASGARMVFITAGMGGGTGTGAAPIIAQIARELDILTVAIVTMPFRAEGPKRKMQAAQGIEEIRKHVDSLLIIDNENINRMYGDLSFTEAFGKADDILATAAKGIAEVITKEFGINVDFADVQTTMSNSGVALMGSASAKIESAENIAQYLTDNALVSPLLNQNNIAGARNILVNISWREKELRMSDVHCIIEIIQQSAGEDSNVIWGAGPDDTLTESDEVGVIIIATGFEFTGTDLNGVANVMDVKPLEIKPQEEELREATIIQLNGEREAASEPVVDEGDFVIRESSASTAPSEEAPAQAVGDGQKVVIDLYGEIKEQKTDTPRVEDDGFEIVEKRVKPEDGRRHRSKKGGDMGHLFDSVEGESSFTSENRVLTIDELEELPAFIRRQMLATIESEGEKSVSQLTFNDEK